MSICSYSLQRLILSCHLLKEEITFDQVGKIYFNIFMEFVRPGLKKTPEWQLQTEETGISSDIVLYLSYINNNVWLPLKTKTDALHVTTRHIYCNHIMIALHEREAAKKSYKWYRPVSPVNIHICTILNDEYDGA